jgi:hypothetical protein
MKVSNWWVRHAFVVASATLATTGAVIAGIAASPGTGAGASTVARAVTPRTPAAHSASFGIHEGRNPFSAARAGYPPPHGIFAPFTDCPLLNPLMQESVGGDATGCVAGDAVSGTFTVGSLSVAVTKPVTAQFGVWSPPDASPTQFSGGVLAPTDGKQLVDSPELVPGGLLKALSCPSSTPSVEKICKEATLPGETSTVMALVQTAGPITNFDLTTWTQPVMIKLINPLLGNNCYIGSTDDPIVLNPSVTGNLGEVLDPNPHFPTTAILEVTDATATDDTFSVPIATGCGPGGSANIAVDLAIDGSDGLPSASGNNSLVLNGNFYLADDYSAKNQAKDLLKAFKAKS